MKFPDTLINTVCRGVFYAKKTACGAYVLMWAADCINTPDEKQQQEHGNVPFQIQEISWILSIQVVFVS